MVSYSFLDLRKMEYQKAINVVSVPESPISKRASAHIYYGNERVSVFSATAASLIHKSLYMQCICSALHRPTLPSGTCIRTHPLTGDAQIA